MSIFKVIQGFKKAELHNILQPIIKKEMVFLKKENEYV